jgi:hypothetical protein
MFTFSLKKMGKNWEIKRTILYCVCEKFCHSILFRTRIFPSLEMHFKTSVTSKVVTTVRYRTYPLFFSLVRFWVTRITSFFLKTIPD